MTYAAWCSPWRRRLQGVLVEPALEPALVNELFVVKEPCLCAAASDTGSGVTRLPAADAEMEGRRAGGNFLVLCREMAAKFVR